MVANVKFNLKKAYAGINIHFNKNFYTTQSQQS